MIPYQFNYTGDWAIKRGSNWFKQVIWKNPDDSLVDLTGYTAKMQVRRAAGDTVVVELSTEDGHILLGGAAGTIDLQLLAAVTAELEAGDYQYDLELTSGVNTYAILEGDLEIKPNITE